MIRTDRFLWPDIIRGLAVLSMIGYHFTYDWVHIAGQQVPWFTGPMGFVWQQSIGLIFTAVAGFSLTLGNPSPKNGFRILLIALLITVVTVGFMPSQSIYFGVLHMLGISLLLLSALDPWLRRIPPRIGFIGVLVVFMVTWPNGAGSLLGNLWNPPNGLGWLQNPLGWPQNTFFSADYYPLLPWFFAVASGYFFGGLVQLKERIEHVRQPILLTLVWVGQHALLLYLLHQPILLGLIRFIVR